MKKMFSLLVVLSALLVSSVCNAQAVEGFGEAPMNPNLSFAQMRLLARQAAIVDVYRQTNGNPFKIVREVFCEGGVYIIQAEI